VLGKGNRMTGEEASQTNLLRSIDHAELRPSATYGDIRRVCLEARHFGIGAVIVHPVHCERAASYLRGSDVRLVGAVGFPSGAFTIEGKLFETREAIAQGVSEIDYVVNLGALCSGNRALVSREMEALREAARNHVLKVTLEACVLTDEQKRLACRLAVDEGVDFVVTSTGFGGAGATVEDVRLMRDTLGAEVCVSAAGDIRTLQNAWELIRAGASRLRTSFGVHIAQEQGHGLREEGERGSQ
jgi:deoxyribose-phosphate aldolase